MLGVLLVVISASGFGSGPLFAKPVYAAGVDWLGLLHWRFVFGALLSWAWLLLWPQHRRALRRISRRRAVILLALGIFFIGNTATYYAALETVPASLAALIVYIYPPLVAVITLRFGRRLQGRRAWGALGIATVGVLLAVGGIDPSAAPPIAGLLLAVASPIIYAVWIVLSARLAGERPDRGTAGRSDEDGAPGMVPHDAPARAALEQPAAAVPEETDPAPAAALMMTATALAYTIAATATGRPVLPSQVPGEAWVGLIGVGVFSTAIAVQGFYAGARRIGAAQAALVSTVEPVFTITLATVLFGERLTLPQVVGGLLVIVAVLLAQTARAEQPERLRAAADPA